jgi:tetratricopeptide (TPR) repeat protein
VHGGVSEIAGLYEQGERLYRESRSLFEEIGDERSAHHLLLRLGYTAFHQGRLDEARELANRSVALDPGARHRRDNAIALGLLGNVERAAGDHAAAVPYLTQSLAAAREIGWSWWEEGILNSLAGAALRLGKLDEAESHALEGLAAARRINAPRGTVAVLANLSRIASAQGDRERAGLLWGAVEAAEARGVAAWALDRPGWDREIVGDGGEEFQRGRAEGRRLSLDEVIERVSRRA